MGFTRAPYLYLVLINRRATFLRLRWIARNQELNKPAMRMNEKVVFARLALQPNDSSTTLFAGSVGVGSGDATRLLHVPSVSHV